MYTPKKGSLRDHVALYICANGPKTISEIANTFHGYRYNTISNAVHQLKFHNGLTLDGGIYSLTEELHAYYSGTPLPPKKEIKLEPRPWKPLPLKNLPSLEARRNDAGPVHDVGYINGSAGVNDVFRGIGFK